MSEKKSSTLKPQSEGKIKKQSKPNFHTKKIKEQKKKMILFFLVAFFSVGFGIFIFLKMKNTSSSGNEMQIGSPSPSITVTTDCPYKSFLNGICVSDSKAQQENIVAVMVENHNDAQPLAGVSQASIIYEAPVEGNIPRWLALFPMSSEVDKVGPVRSARPYYLDWVSEYGDAMYLHVGGSAEALEKIKTFDIFDINEFYFGNVAFWRATNRFAPHNTYTSGKMWRPTFEKEHVWRDEGKYSSWNFGEVTPCDVTSSTACVQNISFSFVSGVYDIVWKYNAETEQYERWQNGRMQKDEQGNVLKADTIVVQRVKMEVLDEIGRRKITTIGEGEVRVYSHGQKVSGTWKKSDRHTRTVFLDSQGEEIMLSAGKIWVEVVPEEIGVVEK